MAPLLGCNSDAWKKLRRRRQFGRPGGKGNLPTVRPFTPELGANRRPENERIRDVQKKPTVQLQQSGTSMRKTFLVTKASARPKNVRYFFTVKGAPELGTSGPGRASSYVCRSLPDSTLESYRKGSERELGVAKKGSRGKLWMKGRCASMKRTSSSQEARQTNDVSERKQLQARGLFTFGHSQKVIRQAGGDQ